MSRENVELVRRVYEDFFERGALPFELTDPEIRIDNIAEFPTPGPYIGHEGLRQWWAEIVEAVPGLRFRLEEVIDVGDDRVVGMLRTFGSELIEQMPSWAVIHWIRDGQVVRTAGYLRREEALEAVGLRE
jgi:ketosteroid isomerase-like protein